MEREQQLARLAELDQLRQAIEDQIQALNAQIERVRRAVKPQIEALNQTLAPIAREVDELRFELFPRATIG